MTLPEINNIVEICIALDIAIIGIAYPIIIDKISNIGTKYSSDYLSELFEDEFPQKKLGFKIFGKKYSYFILFLYLTIISFIPQIFKFQPLYDWDKFWLIRNSADLLVFIFSLILVVLFFMWLDKVSIYNHKSTRLLNYLIKKHHQITAKEDGNYHLKTINEFGYYAIKSQDVHIQKTLVNFYFEEFSKSKKAQKAQKDGKPLVFESDLYQFIYNIISELVENDKNKLRALEHRAVSGVWILGEGFSAVKISQESYTWLWRNLNLIAEKTDFIKMYWSRASQHYDTKLKPISGNNYDLESRTFDNQDDIENREKERRDFLEFNYAFGGLLMFKQNYSAIKYLFNHSSSLPPNYVLLPSSMTEIFTVLHLFSDNNYLLENNIEFKYPFSGLDDYWGQNIREFINSYIALLFIREYSLTRIYTFQDFTSQPHLPDNNTELNYWLKNVLLFEKTVEKVSKNGELIELLNYSGIIEKNNNENIFPHFFEELKQRIEDKIENNEINVDLHAPKVEKFTEQTDLIINQALNKYKIIDNANDLSSEDDVTKFGVNGLHTLYPKVAFTEDDSHLDYDTFLANSVVTNQIDYFIPNSFLTARTKRYLFKEQELKSAIKKLKLNDQYIIVAINPSYGKLELLDDYKQFVIKIHSTNNRVRDTFFILKKSDLPTIKNIEFGDDEIALNKLTTRGNSIYTSVLDLNLAENDSIRERWLDKETESDLRKKVVLTIAFKTVIIWKNIRNVVQINIFSPYSEQGILNNLNDIEPLE
ncbi:hypothetical protein [Flavivirga rizhaonensis]|uniref:Uncharacterized protein n=1 Tax=Flavivirga rizhaonensis TaxID=2559571 RepID=A0A4S1DZ96_9FLAO|nr:hypothetical protein [Flavivirga rizhaonensis]TGV03335.1 hypothetical protein EM932_06580 [Flavivirga rizhaonensis]